jgi:hypothetical protein
MSSKRKQYHVDCHAVKASKFFLVCESHINPDMRVNIPAAMMAKGYSNKESKNRMLQMQVCQEVEKIRGLDPPHPLKAVAAAMTALLTLLPPPNATRVTLTRITPNAPLSTMRNYDLLAGILFPSPMRKMLKTSHQEQIKKQNDKKLLSIHNKAHSCATTLVAVERKKEEKENRHTTNVVIAQVEGEFKAHGYLVHFTKATINSHAANGCG